MERNSHMLCSGNICINRRDRSATGLFFPESFIFAEDRRSLGFSKLDLSTVSFQPKLAKNEQRVNLDTGIFDTLWWDSHHIPGQWREKTNDGRTWIIFGGTILSMFNKRKQFMVGLYWSRSKWSCGQYWLDGRPQDVRPLYAVVEKPSAHR